MRNNLLKKILLLIVIFVLFCHFYTKKKKLPDVGIIGVKKCGTGALIEVLRMHPKVVAPPYDQTEINFWNDEDEMKKGLNYYKSFMPEADEDEKVVVKVAVKAESVHALYNALPDLKLLLIVRNPINRIVSHIMHEYKNPGGIYLGYDMPDIDDIIMGRVPDPDIDVPSQFPGSFSKHLFKLSNYSRKLDMFLSSYSGESIFVVNGEELVNNPAMEIKKVENFLGLEDFFNEEQFFFEENGGKFPCFKFPKPRCMEEDKGLVHPTLKNETIKYLEKHFRPMVESFRKQTGVDLHL